MAPPADMFRFDSTRSDPLLRPVRKSDCPGCGADIIGGSDFVSLAICRTNLHDGFMTSVHDAARVIGWRKKLIEMAQMMKI
jgi:hypothetical protein